MRANAAGVFSGCIPRLEIQRTRISVGAQPASAQPYRPRIDLVGVANVDGVEELRFIEKVDVVSGELSVGCVPGDAVQDRTVATTVASRPETLVYKGFSDVVVGVRVGEIDVLDSAADRPR